MNIKQKIRELQDEIKQTKRLMNIGYDPKNGAGISKVKWMQDWRVEIGNMKRELRVLENLIINK